MNVAVVRRIKRGAALFARSAVVPIAPGVYQVESSNGEPYTVRLAGPTCECLDWRNTANTLRWGAVNETLDLCRGLPLEDGHPICKHIVAARLERGLTNVL